MTIRVVFRPDDEGGRYCPLVVCDICERPIFGDGAAWWLHTDDALLDGLVWHAHKSACGWELEGRLHELGPDALVCDEDLDAWLGHVAHNVRARRRRARTKRARRAVRSRIQRKGNG